MDVKDIKEKLYNENKEYKHLKDKHDELDKKIEKLESHYPMTTDLELEIEKLKKERLYYKDQMLLIEENYLKELKKWRLEEKFGNLEII